MEEYRIDWRKLGNRIAEMRLARGITQMELAEKTGLSLTYIGYIEQGKRHATFDTYLQIVTCLGYTLDDLLTGELQNGPLNFLTWELSQALETCGEYRQGLIIRIVRDMVEMIQMFHSE